jgi:hypothetical protein
VILLLKILAPLNHRIANTGIGSAYQPQAEMAYGLGQRLSLTAHHDGQSLTSRFLLDGERVLAATAGGQTSYYLPDGLGSVRQVTDGQGQVTLTRSFTPWGELLELSGQGDFTWADCWTRPRADYSPAACIPARPTPTFPGRATRWE